MRLKRGQQVGLIIIGLAVFALGVTASAREWPTAGIISLIFPGLLMTVFGILGVFLNVHLKEGNVEWPKIEEPKPVEPSEDAHAGPIEELRKQLAKASERLEYLILAHERAPDDGMTDEERLRLLRHGHAQLDHEISSGIFYGMEDGLSPDDLRKQLDKAQAATEHEERRQQAQFEFGMRDKPPKSVYEDF